MLKRFLILVLSLAAAVANAQSTTTISRLQLQHPDIGYPGGSALHTALANLYTKIGDNMNSRYSEYTVVPQNTTTVVVDHLGVPFAQKLVILYSGTGTSKTLIANPTASGWTIVADGSDPTGSVDVTTPVSGGNQNFTVEVIDGLHGMAVQDPSAVAITGGTLAGVTVGASTLSNTNTYTAKDAANFTLQNASDTTKQARFDLSGVTTGTTRTLTVPDANFTMVGTTATQTLTNKVLSGNTATNLVSGSGTLTLNTSGTETVPNGTDTLVNLSGTQTLSNKTLSSPVITGGTFTPSSFAVADTNFTLQDDGDATKQLQFQLSGVTTGTTRTLTVPDSSDTLVLRTSQDQGAGRLKNKDLESTTSHIVDSTDTTKKFAFDLSTATTGTAMTLKSAQTTNQVVTFPNATDTLVGRATTDTLTNKTLSGNTATNLVNGSGTTNFPSSGTITIPAATDTLVGRATTDTLTNKTITAPVMSSYLDYTEQGSSPSAPATNTLRVYGKTDDNLYFQNHSGTEQQVGSGSGEKNYIQQGSSTAAGWSAISSFGSGAATDTTAADLPRSNTTKTGVEMSVTGVSVVTVTIASPAVFTVTGHNLDDGDIVTLTTSGALPTGLAISTPYYVHRIDANTFNVSTSMTNLLAGTYVNTSGTQSGSQNVANGGNRYDFTLDPSDYNKKLKIQHDQNILSGASDDWEVDVWSCTVAWSSGVCSGTKTRLTLSTDSAGESHLPNLEGTFRTTFDAPGSAAPYLELRYQARTHSNHQLVMSDIVTGPGVVTQGAALGPRLSYIPSTSQGFGTLGVTDLWYTRVGDGLILEGWFTTGTVAASEAQLGLPSGLTVGTITSAHPLGVWQQNSAAGGDFKIGAVIATQGNGYIQFANNDKATAQSPFTAQNANQMFNSSAKVELVNVYIPIAQWAGNGTVNVVQNDCEYAYNTSTSTTASDGTSFAYGPAGAQIQSITADLKRGVKFKTPISVTDKLWIELWDGTTGDPWMDAATYSVSGVPINFSYQNGTSYGVGFSSGKVASEDATVEFGTNAVNLGTYGAGTTRSWSAWSVNTYSWRVKKCAGGQAVGFSAANTTASGLVSYEDSGTFTLSLTGPRTTSSVIHYTRVGKHVDLAWSDNVGAACSSASAFNAASSSVASGLLPFASLNIPIFIQDNSSAQGTPGYIFIQTNGAVQIGKSNAGGSFTASGNCGFYAGAASYTIN